MNQSLAEREQRIRQRAYKLYLQRGRGDGYEVEDWLEAEAELGSKEEFEPKQTAA